MVAAAQRFVSVHGEPFGDAAALPLTVLAQDVGAQIKVVLAGEGADELFGGYGRYRVTRRLGGAGLRATRPLLGPAAQWWGAVRGDSPWARALEAIAWGGGVRSYAALLGSDLTALLSEGAPHAEEVRALVAADWIALDGKGDNEEELARRFDQTRWLANTYLEKTDRATMAGSLEARVPYLDPAVAHRAALLPVDPTKRALRRELERRLPEVRLPDRKKGLAVSLGQLLRAGLDRHARYELESDTSVLCEVMGPSTVNALRARAARSDLTRYRVAMLGQWEETLGAASLR
jgi:asparagine synthase (glutamine-hydrolysing)